MEEVFERVTAKQAVATENQKQNLIQIKNNKLNCKYKRYEILLKLQHQHSKIRQEQYNTVVIFQTKIHKKFLKMEYKNMMH